MNTKELFLIGKIGNKGHFAAICPLNERVENKTNGNYHKGHYLKNKIFYTNSWEESLDDDDGDEEDDYADSFLMKEETKSSYFP